MNRTALVTTNVLIALLFCTAGHAKKVYVLYGFKIGQKSSAPVEQLGKPSQSHTFDDGYSYNMFKLNDHIVVFESDNTRPDLIYAIQIQGKSNQPSMGLGDINLGDPVSKVIKIFGKPDSVREAIDEETKKPMKGIEYYSYTESGNFSIEITDKTVTSIKIMFTGAEEPEGSIVDIRAFLAAVHSKDYFKISEFIHTDFTLNRGKSHSIKTSIIDTLMKSGEINDIFFNNDYGIASIRDNEISGSALRIITDPKMFGHVFTVKKNGAEYELFFIASYDGWVLKEINSLK